MPTHDRMGRVQGRVVERGCAGIGMSVSPYMSPIRLRRLDLMPSCSIRRDLLALLRLRERIDYTVYQSASNAGNDLCCCTPGGRVAGRSVTAGFRKRVRLSIALSARLIDAAARASTTTLSPSRTKVPPGPRRTPRAVITVASASRMRSQLQSPDRYVRPVMRRRSPEKSEADGSQAGLYAQDGSGVPMDSISG